MNVSELLPALVLLLKKCKCPTTFGWLAYASFMLASAGVPFPFFFRPVQTGAIISPDLEKALAACVRNGILHKEDGTYHCICNVDDGTFLMLLSALERIPLELGPASLPYPPAVDVPWCGFSKCAQSPPASEPYRRFQPAAAAGDFGQTNPS